MQIPITWHDAPSTPVLALPVLKAAAAIGVSRQTMWKLVATGKIRKTSYGVIPVSELEQHLKQEIER